MQAVGAQAVKVRHVAFLTKDVTDGRTDGPTDLHPPPAHYNSHASCGARSRTHAASNAALAADAALRDERRVGTPIAPAAWAANVTDGRKSALRPFAKTHSGAARP